MKIRSSERQHNFTVQLFELMDIYSLGGLTLSKTRNFTACVEAVAFDAKETPDLRRAFSRQAIEAKYYLASLINVPLFLLVAQGNEITIYRLEGRGYL